MFGARTAALCMNRLIDRHIDRANPRTSHWIMAREELPVLVVWLLVPVFLLIFFYAAYRLNSLCFKLAPLAVFILCIYSYTKRLEISKTESHAYVKKHLYCRGEADVITH